MTCVPSSEKISLSCSSTGMNVTVDQCIFAGGNEHITLSFNDDTCQSQSNNGTLSISSEGFRFKAKKNKTYLKQFIREKPRTLYKST